MAYRKWFSFLAVLASSVAVVATSSYSYDLTNGDFDVTSDCVTPNFQSTVTVNNYQVTLPPGVTYLTIGFPTVIVVPDQDSTGTVGGVTRTCQSTYSNPDDGDWVYSCFTNDQLTCTIYMKHR